MKKTVRAILCIVLLMAFITTSLGLVAISVKSVKVNTSSVNLFVGMTYKLRVTVNPENATNKKLVFTSGNKNVATVDKNGLIKGIKPGKTIITVASVNNKKAKCNVTVSKVTLPLTKSGATIKIYTGQFGSAPNKKANPADYEIFKKISEETGVKLDWKILDPNYAASMQTMLAAGDVDADMVQVPGDPVKYIVSDLFAPLDELIEKNAPNMRQAFEQRSDIKKLCMYNRKMYVLPHRFSVSSDSKDNRKSLSDWAVTGMIREDVLKNMGLKVPQTIDELHSFLLKWKKENPTKYPWAPRAGFDFGGASYCTLMSLAGSYGMKLGNGNGSDFYPENDKMVYQWTKPQMKEYLAEMNKWWNEGLINPALTGWSTSGKAQADITEGNAVFTQGWLSEIPAYGWHKTKDNGRWMPMQIPTGPHGDRVVMRYAEGILSGYSAVMANSKNKDILMKWLDYALYSELGKIRLYYGLEGVTYDMINGKPKLKDSFVNQADYSGKLYDMGAQMYVLPIPYNLQLTETYGRILYEKTGLLDQYKGLQGIMDDGLQPWYSPLATPEESQTVLKYSTDIATYRNEMLSKFITGKEPISKFDEYVNKLNSLGLDKLQKVEQDKYDRINK